MGSAATGNQIRDYIESFPEETQRVLSKLRAIIKAAAPEATEKISYNMPAFYLKGNLVYFAAYKHHVGLYPLPHVIEAFRTELEGYKTGKGSIQFPLDRPLPEDLITRIVRQRVKENSEKA